MLCVHINSYVRSLAQRLRRPSGMTRGNSRPSASLVTPFGSCPILTAHMKKSPNCTYPNSNMQYCTCIFSMLTVKGAVHASVALRIWSSSVSLIPLNLKTWSRIGQRQVSIWMDPLMLPKQHKWGMVPSCGKSFHRSACMVTLSPKAGAQACADTSLEAVASRCEPARLARFRLGRGSR